MVLTATYTEDALALYMHTVLGGVADTLGFVIGGAHYQHAVNAALRLYGLTNAQTIADASDSAQLEAAARLAIWEHAASISPLLYDTSIGGNSRSRKQIRDAILAELERATRRFHPYDPAYAITATPIIRDGDAFVAREATW